MSLIEGGLRSLDKITRRGGCSVCGFQLKVGGGVEGDGAQSLGAIPAVGDHRRNGLVERTQWRRCRNFREGVSRVGIARSELCEALIRSVRKIGGGETIRGLFIE